MQETYQQPLDPREHAAITEGRYFEPYKEELRALFAALNRTDRWSEDPREMLEYLREGWIGAEHGNAGSKDQFTKDEIAAAMPILARLNLASETMPPDGTHFDEAIDVGGTMQADYRRGGVIRRAIAEHGVTIDRIRKWDGQRPREERDGTNEEILDPEGRFPGHDVRDNPWVQKSMADGRWDWRPATDDEPESGDPWSLTEAEFGRLAMLKHWGSQLRPHRINLALTDLQDPHQELPPVQPGVPPRLVKAYEFATPDGQNIAIQNAAAVSRRKPPYRHTTRSSAEEWLRDNEIPTNARVLFVSSNPHTLRTAQDVYQVLQEQGRGDIELVVAGASAPPDAPIQLYLGEIARLIDKDVKRNYSKLDAA